MTANESPRFPREHTPVREEVDSFRRLMERHTGLVKGTALRRLNGDVALAEDVTQTVFAALALNPGQVRGASLAAWLRRVTERRAVDAIRAENRWRRRGQRAAEEAVAEEEAPVGQADFWGEASPVLEACIAALPTEDRQLLIERFWRKRDLRAMGEARGLSENAVQKRLSRVLRGLRAELRRRGVLGTGSLFSAVLGVSVLRPDFAAAAAPSVSQECLTHVIVMTAKQKLVLGFTAVLLTGLPVYQQTRINALEARVATYEEAPGAGRRAPNVRRAVPPSEPLTAKTETGATAAAPAGQEKSAPNGNTGPLPWSRVATGESADIFTDPGSGGMPGASGRKAADSAAAPDDARLATLVENDVQNYAMRNGHVQWDHAQATGAPDTEEGGDRPTAWAPRTPRSGEQWLQLGYDNAVELREVNIHESYNSGAVSKVTALMPNGDEKTLWTGVAAPGGANEILETAVPVPPGITAGRIKVYVDTNRVASWPEIDAVEIVGADGSRQWATSSAASSSYSDSYNSTTAVNTGLATDAGPRTLGR